MLRLTRNRKSRISDRLAVFAALLLVVSSLAGIGNTNLSSAESHSLAGTTAVADNAPVNMHSSSGKMKKKRNFKVSLFLFRNN